MKPKCAECVWHCLFKPRPDEVARGIEGIECKKPGWEGYTRFEKPDCDGAFFIAMTRGSHEVRD